MINPFIYWPFIPFLLTPTFAPSSVPTPLLDEPKPAIVHPTHAQETWIRALEWCESNGRAEAINPNDLDNTPSYGAFQFKPETFVGFNKKYGLTGELMDREAQYRIVVRMVLDPDRIAFDKQFPDCTRRLGFPPKS
jgi:hypothetical protein